MSVTLLRLAALVCFLAVALGAFGAHALKSALQANAMLGVWEKAVFYHFIHGLALVVLAMQGHRAAYFFLLAGILLFSGSLYVMAIANWKWIGAVTPLGGLCFLAGWAWLAIAPAR